MGGSSFWQTSRKTQRQTPLQVRVGWPSAAPETITGGRTKQWSIGSRRLHSCGWPAEVFALKAGRVGGGPATPRHVTLTFQVTFQVVAAAQADV